MSDRGPTTLEIRRRFTLGSQLGEGAVARVFEASERDRAPNVAVKRLKSEHRENFELRRQFDREAILTALVDHPGAATIYGEGETTDGLPFYVMERLEGEPMTALLATRGSRVSDRYWLERLIDTLIDVCSTVAHAHSRGIVHRDLKPDNVLVAADGSSYVVDWGAALDLQAVRSEASGLVIGTPGYMSPEQARGDSATVDQRADVFSLGVILYEILTGVPPFLGESVEASLAAVQHRRPKPPRRLNRWAPRSLAAICAKALALDRYRRHADAGALAEDLRAWREGRAPSAGQLSLGERLRGFTLRRPALSASLGTLAAVSIVAATIGLTHLRAEQRLAQRGEAIVERINARLEASLAERHPLVALGIIETLAELEAGGELRWSISPAEHQRLEDFIARAAEVEAELDNREDDR